MWSHHIAVRGAVSLTPFYRWENWCSVAKVTQLVELRSDSGHDLSPHTLPRHWPTLHLHSVALEPFWDLPFLCLTVTVKRFSWAFAAWGKARSRGGTLLSPARDSNWEAQWRTQTRNYKAHFFSWAHWWLPSCIAFFTKQFPMCRDQEKPNLLPLFHYPGCTQSCHLTEHKGLQPLTCSGLWEAL